MSATNSILFSSNYPELGEITIRSFNVDEDCTFLHDWVNREYAVFWGMQNATLEEVKKEYRELTTPDHYEVFVGEFDGTPVFVLERYDPKNDLISNHYNALFDDIGIHIIVAPRPAKKINHFTWYIFRTIMEFVFSDHKVERILVEPDIRNKKMFAICERIGFQLGKTVELPNKSAQLAFLERATFKKIASSTNINKRSEMNKIDNTVSPQQAIRHIQSDVWAKANRQLIRKAITEFSHERLITPTISERTKEWKEYTVQTDDNSIVYQFTARRLSLDHLWINEETIRKVSSGEEQPLDGVLFIKEFRQQLGITDAMLPTYLEEIISTLQGAAYKLTKGNPTSPELVLADFQAIEQSMTEGHPCFVANNGRIGFDSGDYRAYAPETGNSFALMWLAGHKSRARYAGIESLPYEKLIKDELGEGAIAEFHEMIKQKGANPDDYLLLPIHPWQWFNKLAHIYAPEIANGNLICLGYGKDQYLAQQSIRTLFNCSNPNNLYVKSALSILNMGFMRGLPYYYLGTAPKMAVWLEDLLYNDPFLAQNGFRMLSEIASVSYVNPYFEEFGPHNDYNKMLASLWRESPMKHVKEGQKPMTMAALLHVDHEGTAFLPELIKASGYSTEMWLEKYFDAYLIPLLHCFYQHDLVFMPHGENIILVLEDHIPKYAFMKDITEEAVILNKDFELPEELNRMLADVPEDVKLLSIFIDVFDDFFRFMVQILEEHADFDEEDFWKTLAQRIISYQEQFPQLVDKFEKYDLFAADFQLSCLNRLQINNNRQMIDLDDPVALLQFTGRLKNPLAQYKLELEELSI